MSGSQHHETHDAFTIHLLTIFLNEDIRLKAIGGLNELRRWASMNAKFIEDSEVFLSHGSQVARADL
jgi:hypothetical protein